MKTDKVIESKRENEFQDYSKFFQHITAEVSKVVIGQEEMTDFMILTLLSNGRVPLEGVPGLAKSLVLTAHQGPR